MPWKKIFQWTGAILLGLLIVFFFVNMRMDFRTSDERTEAYFNEKQVPVEIRRIPFREWELRYLVTGATSDPSAPVILFVHGAPGSADNFHRYLADEDLLARAQLVSMDRPGYGYSSYGKAAPAFSTQAAAVKAVADQFPGRPLLLVGHSYGGPILWRYGLNSPENLQGLLMLAPVNNPDSEPFHSLSAVTRWPLTHRLFSGAWRVAGAEKEDHIEELRKLEADPATLRVPVVHIHGKKDFLAPPDNIDFSRAHISPEFLRLVVLPDANHFIPWTRFDLIKGELRRVLEGGAVD